MRNVTMAINCQFAAAVGQLKMHAGIASTFEDPESSRSRETLMPGETTGKGEPSKQAQKGGKSEE